VTLHSACLLVVSVARVSATIVLGRCRSMSKSVVAHLMKCCSPDKVSTVERQCLSELSLPVMMHKKENYKAGHQHLPSSQIRDHL
jgi:hypothetical protein